MGEWTAMLATALVLPALMTGVGWSFLRRPPRRVNKLYGFRTRRARASQEAWDFAHRLCGQLWLRWGPALGAVSLLAMVPTVGREIGAVSNWTLALLVVQCLVLCLSTVPVNRALKRNFDRRGRRIGGEDPADASAPGENES